MDKEKDLEFIKKFSSIKLLDILKANKIDPSNFYHGKVSSDKLKLVKKDIDKLILDLYFEWMNKDES